MSDSKRILDVPVSLVVVLENATALGVTTGHFQNEFCTRLQDDIRRPNLHINFVQLPVNDWLDVIACVVTPRKVRSVLRMRSVDLSKTDPQPAFRQGHRISSCTCVEHLLACSGDMT